MSRHIAKAKTLTGAAWRSKLAQFGLEPEAAWQALQIDRLGLEVEDVIALGGPVASVNWAKAVQLPKDGAALGFPESDWTEEAPIRACYVWPVQGGHCAGLLDVVTYKNHGPVTPQPLTDERELWRAVWEMLGHRLQGVLALPMIPADDVQADLIASFERERQAILKARAKAVH